MGGMASKTITLTYDPQATWSLPTQVRWKDVLQVQDAVQVVDGQWFLSDAGIRPVHPAYDRLVVIGDRTWRDYGIRVTVTLHGFVPGPQGQLQGGFGILTRWNGHYADAFQPSREWRPSGAIGWYRARWEDKPPRYRNFNISDAVIEDREMVASPPMALPPNSTVVMQMEVRSQAGSPSRYDYQVWQPENPDALLCNLTTRGTPGESPAGSVLLIALYADVTIGDIEGYPL